MYTTLGRWVRPGHYLRRYTVSSQFAEVGSTYSRWYVKRTDAGITVLQYFSKPVSMTMSSLALPSLRFFRELPSAECSKVISP